MRRHAAVFLSVLGVVGCDGGSGVDAGALPRDAQVRDAEARDAGAGRDGGGAGDAGPTERCDAFSARAAGSVTSGALDELSGLAASRSHDGVLYAHNDSGDLARVFLLGTDGSDLGTVTLQGASHRDYEDIAVGPGPGGAPHVYVGDVGDNRARSGSGAPRSEIVVYRFREPSLDLSAAPLSVQVTPEALTFTYPGAPQDCEALAVADDGDLYLLSKVDAGASTLYVARAPLVSGELLALTDVTFTSGSIQATAMDIAPGGGALLVRTYSNVLLYPRAAGASFDEVLLGAPATLTARPEVQGEAIAWRPDGRAYFTASEGDTPVFYAFEGGAACGGW